ncbi:hypothetical protein BDV12DRAFT_163305 [Aspergillus spectabilis]
MFFEHLAAVATNNIRHIDSSSPRHGDAWVQAIRHACRNSARADTKVLIIHHELTGESSERVSVPLVANGNGNGNGNGHERAFQQGYLFKCGDINHVLNRTKIWSDDAIVHRIMIDDPLSEATGALSMRAIMQWLPQIALAAALALTMSSRQWAPVKRRTTYSSSRGSSRAAHLPQYRLLGHSQR